MNNEDNTGTEVLTTEECEAITAEMKTIFLKGEHSEKD